MQPVKYHNRQVLHAVVSCWRHMDHLPLNSVRSSTGLSPCAATALGSGESSTDHAVKEQERAFAPRGTVCSAQEPSAPAPTPLFGKIYTRPRSRSLPPHRQAYQCHSTSLLSWPCAWLVSWSQTRHARKAGPQMFSGWPAPKKGLPGPRLLF